MLSETAPTDSGNPFISFISELQRCDVFVTEMNEPNENKKAKLQGQSWQFDSDGLLRFKGRIWGPNDSMSLQCVRRLFPRTTIRNSQDILARIARSSW